MILFAQAVLLPLCYRSLCNATEAKSQADSVCMVGQFDSATQQATKRGNEYVCVPLRLVANDIPQA